MKPYAPDYVVIDFETTSLEYFRSDFEVVSMAIAYLDEKSKTVSKYYDKPAQIKSVLKKLSEASIPLVVFNATFEIGVLKCFYPDITFKETHDVMRLAQMYDGGGDTKEFGLKAVVARILPEYVGYADKIHTWILQNIPDAKKSNTGAFLSQAPTELLEEYNKKDVEATLDLYRIFTQTFAKQNFDWKIDHALYMSSVKIVVESKIEGVKVNREGLAKYINSIDEEVKEIDRSFLMENFEAVLEVRELLKAKEQAKFKKKIVTELPEFNLGSKQHLEFLFQNVLKQQAKLKTKTGKPSFKSSHLGQWEGAELLANRGKRILVKGQAEKLLEKSAYDSRWHVDLNLCGTTTGRASGGGGLNVQALSRRDKGLMECIEFDEGYVGVSIDLCYPENTEFLTKQGWKKFDDINADEEIWQVNAVTLLGSWAVPTRRIDQTIEQDWVTYSNKVAAIEVTAGHKMLWIGQQNHPTRLDKPEYRLVCKASEIASLTAGCHLPEFTYEKRPVIESVSDKDIWVATMLHADAWYDSRRGVYNVQVSVKKKRDKVEELIGRNVPVRAPRKHQTLEVEQFSYLKIVNPLLDAKSFKNLELLTEHQVDVFVEGLRFWDCSSSTNSERTGRITWGSVKKDEVVKVRDFLVMNGYQVHYRELLHEKFSTGGFYTLYIRKKGAVRFTTKPGKDRPSESLATGSVISNRETKRSVCFEVPEGFLFIKQNNRTYVSGNCAGEPSVTAHFSKDIRYRYATVDGIGKAPFYKDNVLYIDDIYLMYLSVSPYGSVEMKNLFDTGVFEDGRNFVDQWLYNAEFIKTQLKKKRALSKLMALSLAYSIGPQKLQQNLAEQGYVFDLKTCKEAFNAYWVLFSGLKRFSRVKAYELESKGYLVTELGFRIKPNSSHKAFNNYIQSTVAGIIHCLGEHLQSVAPYARIQAQIHDEYVVQVPVDKLEQFREDVQKSADALNKDLDWSLNIRTGFVHGNNWFTAK